MKKRRVGKVSEMRPEYRKQDFPAGLERGRYAAKLSRDAVVVALDPEIAAAFPTSRAVNEALALVLQAARVIHHSKPLKRPNARSPGSGRPARS